MKSIYQELEAARNFADVMRIQERIDNELSGEERRGMQKSLDHLAFMLDEMAGCYEQQAEQAQEAYIAQNYDECGNLLR